MGDASSAYSIAGILVRAHPDHVAAVTTRLSALPGVDVHHQDADRLVVTFEADTGEAQRAGLDLIRRQPGVQAADLVYHYAPPPDAGSGPDRGSRGDS